MNHDSGSKLIQIVDPLGNPTCHAYDAIGRQTEENDAIGAARTMSYNAA